MKLTEQDLQDACEYIMDQTCKATYGDNYKELDVKFDVCRIPFSVRTCVDLFIEWLKIHAKNKSS